jgi:hypothetical protein
MLNETLGSQNENIFTTFKMSFISLSLLKFKNENVFL